MTMLSKCLMPIHFLLLLLTIPSVWAQGPPYQTDYPTPVDFKHYEAYIFGGVDGTPVEYDTLGPAFEFNWARFLGSNSIRYCPWEPCSIE